MEIIIGIENVHTNYSILQYERHIDPIMGPLLENVTLPNPIRV